MKTTRGFNPADRYIYDWGGCSSKKGFAQVDTQQDASYYGTWANPEKLIIFSYCEGDTTLQQAETEEEFTKAIREMEQWNNKHGWGPMKIDGMCNEAIIARFKALNLGDLLH